MVQTCIGSCVGIADVLSSNCPLAASDSVWLKTGILSTVAVESAHHANICSPAVQNIFRRGDMRRSEE